MSKERLNRHQRPIAKRIIVRGTLILDTPTCLGSGDAESPTDLALLRDSISNHALLTGSSVAGALRNYLREREHGYMANEKADDFATLLFGGMRSDDDGNQSPLIIDDAISTKPIQAELRDGVKINSATRTAADKAKYDLELLQAGTEFPLSFELLIEREANAVDLRKALAIALSGLEQGEISLGMKKRRGFGRCHVKEWQVWHFKLEDTSQRNLWLNFEHWHTGLFPNYPTYPSIKEAFEKVGISLDINGEDKRDRFTIHATFQLVGSLLIRSGQDSTGRAPDVVHLKSERIIDEQKYFLPASIRCLLMHYAIKLLTSIPQDINSWSLHNLERFGLLYLILKPSKVKATIISGTSLAGVLRHRAERIVKTLGSCSPIVDQLFGFVVGKQSQASRLVVHEKVIEKATDLVQNRIAIDRFTGGAYHGALFDEQPIFGGDDTIVTIELELRNPEEYEIGLLLLLLKDLWTQDLPVGGESSIGRGRLQGKDATLTRYKWDKEKKLQQKETWTITQAGEKEPLEVSNPGRLNEFVQKLVNYPTEEVKCNE